MTEKNSKTTLKETLENDRDFTAEEAEARNAKTMKLFKIFMAVVFAMILILVVLGLVFEG